LGAVPLGLPPRLRMRPLRGLRLVRAENREDIKTRTQPEEGVSRISKLG
jgi:hypothetical protein